MILFLITQLILLYNFLKRVANALVVALELEAVPSAAY